MLSNARKLTAILFLASTLGSSIIVGYSLTYYLGVSLAIRSISAFVKDFRIGVVDENHILVTTNVAVNNSTPYTFTWLWVEENLYVNQTRAGTTYESFSETNPLIILPQTETNHTLKIHLHFAHLRPEIVEWLKNPSIAKIWDAYIDIYCRDMFAGTIRVPTSASMETH